MHNSFIKWVKNLYNLLVQIPKCCSQNQNSWHNQVSSECIVQDHHIHPIEQYKACFHISSLEDQLEFQRPKIMDQ
jgi:hypothetical protein